MIKFCFAPWYSLTVNWDGSVSPDGVYDGSLGNLKHQTLEEIWKSDRAIELRETWINTGFHKNCHICKKKEDNIGSSRRLYFDDLFSEKHHRPKFYYSKFPNIRYLEINTSNKCNLKCRMCSGAISSAWVRDENILRSLDRAYTRPKNVGYNRLEYDLVGKLFENKDHFKDLEFLSLRGGEPLMEEQNYDILQLLVDWGISENIVVDLSTNGTIIDDRLSRYAEKFKSLKIHLSIEGVDDLYSYIRGGDNFTFVELEKNVKLFQKLPKTRLIFAVTVMIYNIFDLHKIWDWYMGMRRFGNEIYFRNIVVKPVYLNYNILSEELKNRAIPNLCMLPETHGTQGNIGFVNILKSLNKNQYYSEEDRKLYLKQFVEFTNDLDELRETDIRKVVPQLGELFDV